MFYMVTWPYGHLFNTPLESYLLINMTSTWVKVKVMSAQFKLGSLGQSGQVIASESVQIRSIEVISDQKMPALVRTGLFRSDMVG